jgi:hypothetical protein
LQQGNKVLELAIHAKDTKSSLEHHEHSAIRLQQGNKVLELAIQAKDTKSSLEHHEHSAGPPPRLPHRRSIC